MDADRDEARRGWDSTLPVFRDTPARDVRDRLEAFVKDASVQQIRAWDQSIPPLQAEASEIIDTDPSADSYFAIMEYELPMESRRPDVILLAKGTVIVLELKGKQEPSQADLDQAAAYARDLRCYHAECANRPVLAVAVPMRASGYLGEHNGVHIAGPDALDTLVKDLEHSPDAQPLSLDRFLSESAYRPLPTLIQAARELFNHGRVRPIHRARAATDPAVEAISRIIHEAAATRSRRLILLTGVPGAGKTLVGLRTAHAHFLDDLAVARADGTTPSPAVFLSGNGPLVEVLQYELRGGGGGGKTFVRGVKDYVKRYSRRDDLVPNEHVLIFDEAQRAYDAEQVRAKHANTQGFAGGKSEPEHFIEFAERIPEWCVVLGLIGGGQEIHIGEEAGLIQWRHAIEGAKDQSAWTVHGPPGVAQTMDSEAYEFQAVPSLNLDTEIRFHLAKDLHRFVAELLDGAAAEEIRAFADGLERAGHHLRMTRDLDHARRYLRDRYCEAPEARFGLIASSRDKDLGGFGVPNDFQSTKRIRYGPWYGDPEEESSPRSCRHLRDAVTEFGAQGLELDASLLAWGTDFMLKDGAWSSTKARGYRERKRVRDPHQLRVNAYRVLLTRGRDATVVFVPPLPILDETANYLEASGFRSIDRIDCGAPPPG